MPNTWPLQRDCAKFYGNPTSSRNGVPGPSAQWERSDLQVVPLPWVGRLAWAPSTPCVGIRVHKLVAASLGRILLAIWERVGERQSEIDRLGLSQIAGGYCWRMMRGGNALSMHAYGCAVDFDPARNAQGDHHPFFGRPENRWIVEIFAAEGWVWGGQFSRTDGMHFQAARVA